MDTVETETVTPADTKSCFLRSGNNSPIISGNRILWTDIGDGWSYFITDNQDVVSVLNSQADKGLSGVSRSTREEIMQKKSSTLQRQSEIDTNRKRSMEFKAPGLLPRPLPPVQREGQPNGPNAAIAKANTGPRIATVIHGPPKRNLIAPITSVPPVAERAPDFTKPTPVTAESVEPKISPARSVPAVKPAQAEVVLVNEIDPFA